MELGKEVKACPYYASRTRYDDCDLAVMPYNYVLDPMIRDRMQLAVDSNTVLIVDEAHNVDVVCRETASFTLNWTALDALSKRLQYALSDLNAFISHAQEGFEELSHLISASDFGNELELDSEKVFDILHERERLGCTGVGKGIALPHGRMEGLETPIIAMIRLAEPIDYDAPDGEPVWLAVCLLVPAEANEIHLNLLADLAARFSDQNFVEKVYSAESSEALVNLFDGS